MSEQERSGKSPVCACTLHVSEDGCSGWIECCAVHTAWINAGDAIVAHRESTGSDKPGGHVGLVAVASLPDDAWRICGCTPRIQQ